MHHSHKCLVGFRAGMHCGRTPWKHATNNRQLDEVGGFDLVEADAEQTDFPKTLCSLLRSVADTASSWDAVAFLGHDSHQYALHATVVISFARGSDIQPSVNPIPAFFGHR